MKADELIDKLWNEKKLYDEDLRPIMSYPDFKVVLTEALTMQRRGCAEIVDGVLSEKAKEHGTISLSLVEIGEEMKSRILTADPRGEE